MPQHATLAPLLHHQRPGRDEPPARPSRRTDAVQPAARPHQRHRAGLIHRAAGFTLIELMAVVLIMIIMITVGIVALPKMSKALAVDRGAHVVLNTFQRARQIAITRRVDTYVGLGGLLSIAVQNQNFGPHLYTGRMIDNPLRDSLKLFVTPDIPMPLHCEIIYPVWVPGSNPPRSWPANGVTTNTRPGFGSVTHTNFNGTTWVNVLVNVPNMGSDLGSDKYFCVVFDKYGRAAMTTTTVVAEITAMYGIDWKTPNKLGIVTEKGTGRIYITRDVPLDITSWLTP